MTTVNEQYRTRFQTYSDSLANLSNATYIDSVLGSGTKSGYDFAYTLGSQNTWSCSADPSDPGTTGDRYFFADQTGVIRFNGAASAGPADPPID